MFADADLELHRPHMLAQAWRLTGQQADAEDIVQDSMIRALHYREKFDGRNLGGWLNRIVYTTFATTYRRAQRAPMLTWTGEVNDGVIDAVPDLSTETRRALESLIPQYRKAIVMVDLYGYSYREVADEMGTTTGTIATRLHRARAAMREALS